jgi:hypothetical protein
MTWDERDHPRDEAGRFRDKTGAWVTAISDAIETRQTGHTPARGRDLTDSGDVDWGGLAEVVRSQSGDNFNEQAPDQALGQIYQAQGYHGRPRVVSREEMDRLVGQGWVEIWRGHAGVATSVEQASERTEMYRSGDQHYPGQGIYGNGSYFGPLRRAREYAKFDVVAFRRDFPGDSGSFEAADAAFDDPHGPYWHGLTRAVLPPDARVIDKQDAVAFYREHIGRASREERSDRQWVLADLGRASALRGYDAIRVETGNGDEVYYVVLNRSILVVQEG